MDKEKYKNHELSNIDLSRDIQNKSITAYLIFLLIILRVIVSVARLMQYDITPFFRFLFEGSTYLFIAILIFYNREYLPFYRFDKISLWLVLIGGFLLWPAQEGMSPSIPFLFYTCITIGIIFATRNSNFSRDKLSLMWPFMGVLCGSIFIILINLPIGKVLDISQPLETSFLFYLISFIVQLSHSAILEEPVFRGFLWGYLRARGYSNTAVLVIQAILFWVVHINSFSSQYFFWIVTPLSGILLGLLVWRSGSITASIMAHAIINTIIILLAT